MFDRVFEAIERLLGYVQFFVIVRAYQAGIVLRWGKYKRTIEPGWRWMWPVIEDVLIDNMITTTSNLGPQSLTTADGVSVVVSAVVTWKIRDLEGLKTLLLEVEGHEDVMFDTAYGLIGAAVVRSQFTELQLPEFADGVTKTVRSKARKYGIEVQGVQFSDVVKCRSLRLWGAKLG